MQGKCCGSESAVGESRFPVQRELPLSRLPGLVDAAGVQTGVAQKRGRLSRSLDAPRSGSQGAARLGDSSVREASPLMTEPGDLVARALEILAEEDEAWRSRRGGDLSPRSVR
jgi:hypothetical protein